MGFNSAFKGLTIAKFLVHQTCKILMPVFCFQLIKAYKVCISAEIFTLLKDVSSLLVSSRVTVCHHTQCFMCECSCTFSVKDRLTEINSAVLFQANCAAEAAISVRVVLFCSILDTAFHI